MTIFSLVFVLAVIVAFAIYWSMDNIRVKNSVLAISAVGFYALGGVAAAVLMVMLTAINYWGGWILVTKRSHWCRDNRLLTAAILVSLNIGVLFVFKYYSFFIDNVATFMSRMGLDVRLPYLRLFVPLGLSFYIFMLTSHVIDCYKGSMNIVPKPEAFFAYIAFFPHVFAGPIDRSRYIIPQLQSKRIFNFEQAREGLWQILNGLFKKIAVADTCAVCVDSVWNDVSAYSSLTVLIVIALYSMQIYCDFSGFTDIALGLGKLFGINLMINFRYPYFSRNISEFWRRWHISLTSWLTEYVYIPLGGNRKGIMRTCCNTVIVFALCGLWHGASMAYLSWGIVCGLMFIPYILQPNPVKYKDTVSALSLKNLTKMSVTFVCVSLTWIIFRGAQSPDGAIAAFVRQLMTSSFLTLSYVPYLRMALVLCLLVIVVEWRLRFFEFALQALIRVPRLVRWIIYVLLSVIVFEVYMHQPIEMNADSFIYQNF